MKPISRQEKRIRALEDKLAMARLTVIIMTGEEMRHILLCPSKVDSTAAVHYWFRDAMERVLALADVLTIEESPPKGKYANCPLCGESPHGFNPERAGYVYQEDLRQHLLGNHRRTQCGVSKIALDYALSSIDQRHGSHSCGSAPPQLEITCLDSSRLRTRPQNGIDRQDEKYSGHSEQQPSSNDLVDHNANHAATQE